MKLTEIRIKNFRSIKTCDLTLDKNLQILVGVNESGKSNILKAISLIEKTVELNKNDIRDTSPDEDNIDESFVRFIFKLSQEDEKLILAKAEEKILAKSKNATLLTIGDSEKNLLGFIKHKSEALYTVDLIDKKRLAQHWTISGPQYRINPDWKMINAEKATTNLNTELKNYRIVNIKDYPETDPSLLKDMDIGSLNTFIGNFFTDAVEKSLPPCIFWTYRDSLLLPGKINYESFQKDSSTCTPLRIMFNLAGIDDITTALKDAEEKTNGTKNLFKRVSENATTHMKKVWPEWKNLKVQIAQNGEFIEAGIEDDYNFYSLERRSDGFKRFFTFLLMISAKNKTNEIKNNIILIDEPEIGIHPSGQNYLKEELIKISTNNTVFASTHSIFMIDKEKADRHIIVKKEKEVTTTKTIEASNITEEEVIFKALGFSVFELLNQKNIIFEGWRDKKVFEIFLKKQKSTTIEQKKHLKNIGLLHALGVKDVARIANMCENFNREYIIITDSDKPAIEKKNSHQGTGKWMLYTDIESITAKTTEDFISNKFINRCIKDVFKDEGITSSFQIEEKLEFGVIEKIESHIKTLDEFNTGAKSITNKIKERIIEKMTPDDINENYKDIAHKLINELIQKLEN